MNTSSLTTTLSAGPKYLFLFRGILEGMYTSGIACAVATTKAEAVATLVATFKNDEDLEKAWDIYWDDLRDRANAARSKNGEDMTKELLCGDYQRLTGKTWDDWALAVPRRKNHTGTWNARAKGSLVPYFQKELEECVPEIVPLNAPFGFYVGGGD